MSRSMILLIVADFDAVGEDAKVFAESAVSPAWKKGYGRDHPQHLKSNFRGLAFNLVFRAGINFRVKRREKVV